MATGNSLTDHLLSDHLLCTICCAIFTDPVSLKCQHTFCLHCLTDSLNAGHRQCPVCRGPIKQDDFTVNRILRDIAQELKRGMEAGSSEGPEVCPEHDQPLKLWCKKDKQLLCLVCRDSREHQGHRFQPLDEAMGDLQKEVASALRVLRGDISKVERLSQRQQLEATTLRVKVDTHKSQITNKFAELREALKRMEEKELQKVEQSSLVGMEENLREINELLKRGAEREKLLQAAVECNDSVPFLRWWGQKSAMSGQIITLKGDNLPSPSRSFPRMCLMNSKVQFTQPSSLVPLIRPVIEKSLKRRIVPKLTVWEPPLFGNVWDKIRLFCRRN